MAARTVFLQVAIFLTYPMHVSQKWLLDDDPKLEEHTSYIYLFYPKGSPFPKLLERTLTGQPASKKG